MKYIFKWYVTDGCSYGYDKIIPFICDDVTAFKLDLIEKIRSSVNGIYAFDTWLNTSDIDQIENSIISLESWFENEKWKL